MLTPQEVSGKGFPKSSFGSSGYNMAAVDEFLDTLTDDYTTLYKENATLKSKLKVLAEKVEEYRATEDAMRSTLLTAQRMAAKLVQEAQTEKDQILADSRAEATRQIADLDDQTRQAEARLAMARQSLGEFLSRSRELCAQQAEFLKTLPELGDAVYSVLSGDFISQQITFLHASEITIEANNPMDWTLDGEYHGGDRLVKIVNHKQALHVDVPEANAPEEPLP